MSWNVQPEDSDCRVNLLSDVDYVMLCKH